MRHTRSLRWLAAGLFPLAFSLPAFSALSFTQPGSSDEPPLQNDFLPEEMESSLDPDQVEALTQQAPEPHSTMPQADATTSRFLERVVTPGALTTLLRNMSQSDALMHRMPYLAGMAAHPGKWSLALAPQPIKTAVDNGTITEEQARFSFEQQKTFYEWTQDNPNSRYLIVNVPTYDLVLYGSPQKASTLLHHYTKTWSSKSIVGRSGYESPDQSLNVVSLKYNPTWTPTPNAIRRNVLTKDGDWNWEWIDKHNFIPHSRRTEEPISWPEATHLPIEAMYFVEPHGPKNTLGEIKFETDSKNYIYLHDTNARWYFDRNERAISTGCVRVEDPKGLAAALLHRDVDYVQSQLDIGKMFWERIDSVPFYFMYDMVEYDSEGNVLGIGHDPYGRFDEWVENTVNLDMHGFDYEVKRL